MPHLSYARCGSAIFPRCPLNWTSCRRLWALNGTWALLGTTRGSVVFRKVFSTQVWQLTVLHYTTQEVPSSGVQSPGGQQTAFSGKRTPSALQGPPQGWFSRLQQGHNTKPTQLELTGTCVVVVTLSLFSLSALLRKVRQHVAMWATTSESQSQVSSLRLSTHLSTEEAVDLTHFFRHGLDDQSTQTMVKSQQKGCERIVRSHSMGQAKDVRTISPLFYTFKLWWVTQSCLQLFSSQSQKNLMSFCCFVCLFFVFKRRAQASLLHY